MATLPVPKEVARAAAQGVALVAEGYEGARSLGKARGRQLAGRPSISWEDAMVMRAWFARHQVTSRPSFLRWQRASAAERRSTDAWRGAVAWLLWGGEPAYAWILSAEVQAGIVRWGKEHGRPSLKRHVERRH